MNKERVNFLKKMFYGISPVISRNPKQNVSEFVKRMNALKARLQPKLLWISRHPKSLAGLTYVKKVHGELKA